MVELAGKLGIADKVVVTGFRTDIPAILADVSIAVSSSTAEGLSNTLLEASGAGIPVIATGVGGNPEIVVHGRTGLLVPPRDPDALAVAMSHILDNPELARWMGNAGKQRVAEHFSVDRMVRQTEALYAELAGQMQRGAA
jgi:glycosyltransferase involved in cell wall biosynthesis